MRISRKGKLLLNFGKTEPFPRAVNDPFECFGQRFAEDQPTGFADGRQAHLSPFLRTVVPHLPHESGVRQDD